MWSRRERRNSPVATAATSVSQALDASTRGRLVWVEVAMMCTLLVMGLWQINYLKAFFQAKKIL